MNYCRKKLCANTGWKQPCDQGIINALKTRYKFLYLRNVLSFYELNDNEKTALKGQGKKLSRGSAGVRFGNPAHLLDAAKDLKEAWDSILPISIENCFRKADISIEFRDAICPGQDIIKTEQVYELIEDMEELTIEDIDAFVHADDHDAPEFVEAMKEDINDLMDKLRKVQPDMNEDEEINNDKIVNLNDPPVVCNIEDVFADIVSLGPKIMHTFTKESHQGLCIAYETMLSLAMNIKREQNRKKSMMPKVQSAIRDFFQMKKKI